MCCWCSDFLGPEQREGGGFPWWHWAGGTVLAHHGGTLQPHLVCWTRSATKVAHLVKETVMISTKLSEHFITTTMDNIYLGFYYVFKWLIFGGRLLKEFWIWFCVSLKVTDKWSLNLLFFLLRACMLFNTFPPSSTLIMMKNTQGNIYMVNLPFKPFLGVLFSGIRCICILLQLSLLPSSGFFSSWQTETLNPFWLCKESRK